MRHFPVLLGSIVAAAAFAGCTGDDPVPVSGPAGPPTSLFSSPHKVWASTGSNVSLNITDAVGDLRTLVGSLHAVGEPGAEPSVGVTSKGNIFFQAFEKTMRSMDGGATWSQVSDLLTATDTSDPYLWVDPTTDRVFQVNMVSLVCSHIAWSDDEGESWLGNPMDCGPVPVNDHIKLGTGPWTGALSALGMNPAYPNAVYYAYNKLAGAFMAVSLDGGATFPILNMMYPSSGCGSALHGAVATAPDGAVYVPGRCGPGPIVAYSHDNGLTWDNVIVGAGVGVPDQQKNPEIAVDTANTVYMDWVGADNRLHLSTSRDRGATWSDAVGVTPPEIGSVVWPTLVAGDPGRIGMAYIGTTMSTQGAWEVDNSTEWHLYYTYSLNALDADPTFVTVQLTDDADPIQKGTVCVSSGACRQGNRNLLDFIDLSLDADGRPYVAYADGCTSDKCRSAEGGPLDSRDRAGMVAILQVAPSVYEEKGVLAPLAAT